MEDKKKWVAIFGFSAIALIFSVAAIYTPWWRVTTTREEEIMNNRTISSGYWLSQKVYASENSKVGLTWHDKHAVYLSGNNVTFRLPNNNTKIEIEAYWVTRQRGNQSYTSFLFSGVWHDFWTGYHRQNLTTLDDEEEITENMVIRAWKSLEGYSEIDMKCDFGTFHIFWTYNSTEHSNLRDAWKKGELHAEIGCSTVAFAVPLEDMPASNEDKNALKSLCTITLDTLATGVAFNALAIALTLTSFIRKKLYTVAKYAAIISAILLLIAAIYFSYGFIPIISKFESVTPTTLCILPGKQISSMWGEIEMSSGLQQWLWGPAFGWYLAFTAFLLNAATFILICIIGKTRR